MSVPARDDLASWSDWLWGIASCSPICLQHLQVLVWMCKRQNHQQRGILCIAWRMSRTKMKTHAVAINRNAWGAPWSSSSAKVILTPHIGWKRLETRPTMFSYQKTWLYIDSSSTTSRSLSPTHLLRHTKRTRRYKKLRGWMHRRKFRSSIRSIWWTETWTFLEISAR